MRKLPVIIPYIDSAEEAAIADALRSGWVAQGSRTAEFEKLVAAHEGVSYGIAVNSCTSALHLAMICSGMGQGMDAICPSFTFVATANSVAMTGARPVLTDVQSDGYNIDPEAVEDIIETRYEDKAGKLVSRDNANTLWGIVPVHQFGLCCDIHAINMLAKRYGLKVIEDAACAFGATIDGVHEGAFGNLSCLSFHPRKSITTGEGGMILTNSEETAKKLRELRSHSSSVSADSRHAGKGFLLPEFNALGYNYRMTDIQGAMGVAQMGKVDYILHERCKLAEHYTELIQERLPEFIPPHVPKTYGHSYQSYVCMLDREKLGLKSLEEGGKFRNALLSRLEERGISTRQGTHAVHTLGYYRSTYGYHPEDLPNALACDHLSVTLPLFIGITDEEQQYVIYTISKEIKELLGG